MRYINAQTYLLTVLALAAQHIVDNFQYIWHSCHLYDAMKT